MAQPKSELKIVFGAMTFGREGALFPPSSLSLTRSYAIPIVIPKI